MATPYLIYCTPDGEIREEPRLQALAFGDRPLDPAELIPLPDGVVLSMMPDRLAVGQVRDGERSIVVASRAGPRLLCFPSAIHAHCYPRTKRCRTRSLCLSLAIVLLQGCMVACM